jgi:predicted outer membrane repeat protein
MAKIPVKLAFLIFFSLAFVSCTNLTVNTELPVRENFQELDKEYNNLQSNGSGNSFSIKEITQSYLQRKLRNWLDIHNGPMLIKEILYAKTKYPDLFKMLMADEPNLLEEIFLYPPIISRMAIDASFKKFLEDSIPTFQGVPGGLSVTDITLTSFKANWNFVTGATSYEIVVDNNAPVDLGNVTSYQVINLTDMSHSFKVRAKKSIMTGEYSEIFNLILLLCIDSNIIFVDKNANGNNDGSNWTSAFNSLQDALAFAASGSNIFVAAGTYKPDPLVSGSFNLKDGVNVYGGFAGTETNLCQRILSPSTETILSGDLNNNGIGDSDDVWHVVLGATGSTIDGFTIKFGFADGGSDSSSTRGGGMYNQNSSPIVSNVIFSDNYASLVGGGMYNERSSPTVINVTFSGNKADYFGGGMYNQDSLSIVSNVTFIGNTASLVGGGMYNFENSSLTVNKVIFSGNSAGYFGGGMYNQESSPIVSNVTFTDNTASLVGGGMYNMQNSSPEIINVTFSGNSASYFGGGMYNSEHSSPLVSNVTFSGNTAGYFGGGMYNMQNSSPTVINVTFSGNTAGYYGGGIYNSDRSSLIVKNSIFWQNDIVVSMNSTLKIGYSDVEGGFSAITINENSVLQNLNGDMITDDTTFTNSFNINADPLFLSPTDLDGINNILRTSDDGLSLKKVPVISPAIDTGTTDGTSSTDITGKTRDNFPDMGAYEF